MFVQTLMDVYIGQPYLDKNYKVSYLKPSKPGPVQGRHPGKSWASSPHTGADPPRTAGVARTVRGRAPTKRLRDKPDAAIALPHCPEGLTPVESEGSSMNGPQEDARGKTRRGTFPNPPPGARLSPVQPG